MRLRLLALAAVLGLSVGLPAQAPVVDYNLVYIRAPRPAGDATTGKFPDIFNPAFVEPGSELMLLEPDGDEEVLATAGATGAITDPCVSFDAQYVYYAKFPDAVNYNTATFPFMPDAGSNIWKVNVATRVHTQLTFDEWTPNTGVFTGPQPFATFNLGACPVSGGRVVFTSNRNGFIPPKAFTPVTMQLYVMNEDGSNVHAIAPMTIGSALHPSQLADGRIMFSSAESQGLRDQRAWGLWAIWPDGRLWEPLFSAFSDQGTALHFSTQLSDGDIVVEDYYNQHNGGFGTIYRFNNTDGFSPADVTLTTQLAYTAVDGTPQTAKYSFAPVGGVSLTPWTHMGDEAAPIPSGGGARVGKVTHPSGAPGGDCLLVWTPGPANDFERPISTPAVQAGLYVREGCDVMASPADMTLIKNDSNYNEQWPRALVPYVDIYGVTEPVEFSFLPNNGTLHASLPAGTPYGLIGTSSFYLRESFPGFGAAGFDGLEAFNSGANSGGGGNWFIQGSDVGKISNADIHAVRIVTLEATSHGLRAWSNVATERMRILGEIPLRKESGGMPVLDTNGDPDTSFWAKIPADVPFTFQMIDSRGRMLSMAQTWHQVRPGEIRTNCGGCHAHSSVPLAFNTTAAFTQTPTDLSTAVSTDVEFVRDIRPILQAKCVSCHSGGSPPANLTLVSTSNTDFNRLANDPNAAGGIPPVLLVVGQPTWRPFNLSRYIRAFQGRRSLLVWLLAGARLDGFTNAQFPTETTPGDVSTLPGGSGPTNVNMADLNYDAGTVDHTVILTDAEENLFHRWIDLGTPFDSGGYFQDETRPTLALTAYETTLIVGAADSYSGLNGSPTATVDGVPVTLSSLGDGRWNASLAAGPHTVVGAVSDMAGNITTLTRTLTGVSGGAPGLGRFAPTNRRRRN